MSDQLRNLLNLPIELRSLAQFLIWRLVYNPKKNNGKGGFDKVPYSALTHIKCDPLNSSNWVSFDIAFEQYKLNPDIYAGVGFSIKQAGGIFCVDVDNCMDKQGVLKPEAQEILNALPPSFTEISQSGLGLHYWGHGNLQPDHLCKYKLPNEVKVEVYSHSRYIAVTGNVYKGGETFAC